METLAQSVSTIAPTATPAATIPLVCALAGNGTWLAYVLATVGDLAGGVVRGPIRAIFIVAGVALQLRRDDPAAVVVLDRGLELAAGVCGTASSVIGGLYQYAMIFVGKSGIHPVEAVLISLLVTGASVWIAWRDVKISARLMLWIEAVSVFMIITLVTLVLVRHGSHVDSDQLH